MTNYSPVPISLNLQGEEVGKEKGKREAQGMRLVPVLWREMSVKNTRPKYVGRLSTS